MEDCIDYNIQITKLGSPLMLLSTTSSNLINQERPEKLWAKFIKTIRFSSLPLTYIVHLFKKRYFLFSYERLQALKTLFIETGKSSDLADEFLTIIKQKAAQDAHMSEGDRQVFLKRIARIEYSNAVSSPKGLNLRIYRFELEQSLKAMKLTKSWEIIKVKTVDFTDLSQYIRKGQESLIISKIPALIHTPIIQSPMCLVLVDLLQRAQRTLDSRIHEKSDENICGKRWKNEMGTNMLNDSEEREYARQATQNLEISAMTQRDGQLQYKLGLIVLHNTFITQIHPTITMNDFISSFQNVAKTTGIVSSELHLFNLLDDYELHGLIQIERESAQNYLENRGSQKTSGIQNKTQIKILRSARTIKKKLLSNEDDAKFQRFLFETPDVGSEDEDPQIISTKHFNAQKHELLERKTNSSWEKECETRKFQNIWGELATKIDRLEHANVLKDQEIAKLEKIFKILLFKKIDIKKKRFLNDFGTEEEALPPNNELMFKIDENGANMKELTISKKDFPSSLSLLEKMGLVVLYQMLSAFTKKNDPPTKKKKKSLLSAKHLPQTTYQVFYNVLKQLQIVTKELFTQEMLQTAVQDNLLHQLETQLFVQMHVKGHNQVILYPGNPKRCEHLKDPCTVVTIRTTQEDIKSTLFNKETGGDYFVNLLSIEDNNGRLENIGETPSLAKNKSKFSSRLRPILQKIESPTKNEMILLLSLIKNKLPLQFKHNSFDLSNALQVMVNVLIDHVTRTIIRSHDEFSPSEFWNLLIQLLRASSCSSGVGNTSDSQDPLPEPQEIFDQITTEIYGDNNNQNAQAAEITPNQIFSIAMKQHPKLQTLFHYYPASTLENGTFMNTESWKYSKQVYLKKNISQNKGDDGYFLSDFTLGGPSIDDQLITHEDGRDAPQLLYVTSFEWNDALRAKGASYNGRKPVVNWVKSWGDNACILSAPMVDNLKRLSYRLVALILLLKNKPHVHRGSLLVNSQEEKYHQYCLITKRGGCSNQWYYCHNEKCVTACFGNHFDNAFLPSNQHNYTVSEYSHETHAAIFEKITY
jgi:hypothetical protein